MQIVSVEDKIWVVLQIGDEVQTSEETLRETAIYRDRKTFVLDQNTEIRVPYFSDENNDIQYLDVKNDSIYGAYVEIPEGFECISCDNNILDLKRVGDTKGQTDSSLANWRKAVADGKTELGYEDWKSLMEDN